LAGVVRQREIQAHQDRERRVAMKLTHVVHQFLDGRAGKLQRATANHDQAVSEYPRA